MREKFRKFKRFAKKEIVLLTTLKEYCRRDYVRILKDNGIKISLSVKANQYYNINVESFFRNLKVEVMYISEFQKFKDINSISCFIKELYKKKDYILSREYGPWKIFNINLIKKSIISWF